MLKIENGTLVPYEFPDRDYKEELPVDAVEPQKPQAPKDWLGGSEKGEKKGEVAMNLMIADRQVYRTYFGSFGRTHLIIFFVLGLAFAFTLRFPG